MLIKLVAAQKLIEESADIENAYFYGNMDKHIIIKQLTDSSKIQ